SGETGLQIDMFGETQRLDGDDQIRFTNKSFQEYLLYRLRGYAYHPRFLQFDADFKLGMLQQRLGQSGTQGDSISGGGRNTVLDGYDVYLRFFQEHPLSLSLFAQHDRSAVLELFTDRILIDQRG